MPEAIRHMLKQIESPMDLFENGIKRSPGPLLLPPPKAKHINLGSGFSTIIGVDNLDLPEWRAPLLMDYENESVGAVHAYHFLEHLDYEDLMAMLGEVDRVLLPGGVMYIAVPHAMSALGYQALDHRTFWTEEGLQDLFYSAGYDARFGEKWSIEIAFMMVAGIRAHNMCLLAQLYKPIVGESFDSPWKRV